MEEQETSMLEELRDGKMKTANHGNGGGSRGGSDSGLEENGFPLNEGGASCDSSLVSYCNSSEELISNNAPGAESECGSESSSVKSHERSASSRLRVSESRQSRPGPGVKEKRPTSLCRGTSLGRSLSVRQGEPRGSPSPLNPSRVRSPQVIQDDGRWPSSVTRNKKSPMTSSMGPIEAGVKFATTPRRRRRSAENLLASVAADRPREPSLNRTASLRRKKIQDNAAANAAPAIRPSLPPSAKRSVKPRTRIFHEVSVQTSLTGRDLEGCGKRPPPDVHKRVLTSNAAVQADRRIQFVEKLENEVKELNAKLKKAALDRQNLEKIKAELKEERDKTSKMNYRLKLLVPVDCEDEPLEAILKEHTLTKEAYQSQQYEISQLTAACAHLKKELERTQTASRRLLEQAQEAETESLEVQEFLQAEKSTLADTLKEIEGELSKMTKALDGKNAELDKKQEECTHLVRMCEQRRQENLYLESRLKAVENSCKETMIVHGAAVSGASVALSGLSSRLEHLIQSLVSTYDISSSDLEDLIFHNEAFCQSDSSSSSSDHSPEPSPVRRRKSGFLSAIITAIKGATVSNTVSDELLISAEPEPSAFSGEIGELTALSSPDKGKRLSTGSLPSLPSNELSPLSRSHHRPSFAGSDDLDLLGEFEMSEGGLTNSESLKNLSDAIIRRQEEEAANESFRPPPPRPCGLIDQVIEVDNLVTKLLKVLAFAQKSELPSDTDGSRDDVIASLKADIERLNTELQLSSKSSLQVEELQKALREKSQELDKFEKKRAVAEQLLTENWHKAMSEVRRQYESIDKALEVLQDSEETSVAQARHHLEEANFRCLSTLPVSTSKPDLNANSGSDIIPK